MRQLTFALAVGLAFTLRASAADLRHFDDAPLHAVQFINAQEGWAVGDEGVILKTIDGGQTWERLASGTRASLRGVHFVNGFFGWVVGREELPHGLGSVGVLLFTRDGGVNWQPLLENSLPGLNQVRFVEEQAGVVDQVKLADSQTGFIFGDSNELFPTGVIKTTDGGKSWAPVPGPRATTWLDGRFAKGPEGILVGAWSRFAKVRPDKFSMGNGQELVKDLGGRSLRGVVWLDRRALAVGDGGLIAISESEGSKWDTVKLNLPLEVLQALDFRGIHGVGTRAWAVGRPGSVILHTADQGKTWKLQRTKQNLPLNGVFFRDELVGWAVGEGGTIVATGDGGNTWKVQRQGGKRAALLAVNARATDTPLETIAALGGEEGYLTTALSVYSPDPLSALPSQATQSLRWSRAVRQVGGLAAEALWQFPVPPHLVHADKSELLRHWNLMHNPGGDQSGADKLLLRQLVLALRMWRPDVVVTDPTNAKGAGLVAEIMREAFTLAADAKAFPEQIEALALEPWRAGQLFAIEENVRSAPLTMDGNRACPRLEATARDCAALAGGLLHDQPCDYPAQRGFRLIENTAKDNGDPRRLITCSGEDVRRKLAPLRELDDVTKTIQARRNLEAMAEKVNDPRFANQPLAALAKALGELPVDQGAAAAFTVANQYVRKGQWLLARETFLLMVDRYPAHPLSADAYRWLIRHSSSSEARRRQELGQFFLKTDTFAPPKQDGPIQQTGVNQRMQQQGNYLSDKEQSRHWYRGSLEFGKRLAGFGSAYFLDPPTQFCLQSSRRQLGEVEESSKWYGMIKNRFGDGHWQDAATDELWATRGGPSSTKVRDHCLFTERKPFLDGKLDDPCWQNRKPMFMRSVGAELAKEYRTEAWFAFDQEFLYVALRCRHPAGQRVAPVKPRTTDADLIAFDRVSITIDLDRDYATYFQLQVDQRGCVRDDCWGDLSWNPKWFVAVESTDDCWQIEAAIPLGELTSDRIMPTTVWACNVVRTIPGRGLQAWSTPADVEPKPEGMGLLQFRDRQ
jgi:photosystem II stability/assembly factor-like uncharacterized protein